MFFVVFGAFVVIKQAKAGVTDNVSGWAWSENIGWISFNSTNCDTDGDGTREASEGTAGCPAVGTIIPNYGVKIATDGTLSGYAWSENIGWISFNAADLAGCPSGTCNAQVNLANGQVSGWARALAGISGGGGWDGWIKLAGNGLSWNGSACVGINDYGNTNRCNWGVKINTTTGDFSGWAWSDMVVGWISFNSKDCDPNGDGNPSDGPAGCVEAGRNYSINPIPNYKVTTTFSFGPSLSGLTYSFANHCSQSRIPVLSWDTSAADPQYEIEILTTGITGSGSGKAWSPACNGCCDVFPYNNVSFGNQTYSWRVGVRDGGGPWSSWEQSSFTTRLNCDPVASFDISTQNPSAGEVVNATNTSQAFGGATISSCLWEITPPAPGGGTFVLPTTKNSCNPKIKFSILATSLKLTATDSSNYSCEATKTINMRLPLPDWIEVPPQ